MAYLKKNQMNQVMLLAVDKTDFATIESGITASDFNSGMTGKFFGVNHGVSTAFTSGTISKAATLVRSGIFQQTLKAAECNYDYVVFHWSGHASLATIVMPFQTLTNDDSDLYSLLSDLQSDFQSRVPKEVASKSLLSDVRSDLRSQISGITASISVSDISDIASRVWSEKYAAHSLASSFGSLFSLMATGVDTAESRTLRTMSDASDILSRVPKEVASKSLLSDVHSDLRSQMSTVGGAVTVSNISDIASRVWSEKYAAHSLASSFGSLFSLIGASLSEWSDLRSDLKSAIAAGPAATVTASDISDIASAVWAAKYNAHSLASSFGSLVSLMATGIDNTESRTLRTLSDASDILSRIPKEVASKSLVSDVRSDLRSQISGITASVSTSDISDIASRVWSEKYAAHSLASSFGSLFSQIATKAGQASALSGIVSDAHSAATQANSRALVIESQVSDIESQLDVTHSLLSDVESQVDLNASVISDAHSAAILGASHASDAHSAALLVQSRLSDLDSKLASVVNAQVLDVISTDTFAEPTAVPAATASLKDKIGWLAALSRNKITQTSAVQSLRNDADSADIASAAVSDDGTTATRGEFA